MSTKTKKEKAAKADDVVRQKEGISKETVTRKINKDELISLQKEGKLAGYDPATGIGVVRTEGYKTKWPGGDPKVA